MKIWSQSEVHTEVTDFYQTLCAALRSTVARNAASLYIIQFTNYIVPLVMVPYLVRVLGPAGYGAVAFAQGFINYLMLFVEYGFDWSATRKISVERDDHQAVNRTAVHVWAAKGLLSLVGLCVFLLLVSLVPKLREVSWLLLALYGLMLGNGLFPTWLFQGMERMVAISLINLGMKLGVLVGVFALVRRPEDVLVYSCLLGGGSVAAGLVGMVVSMRMFRLKPARISWAGIWGALREGWVLFLSKASVSLYTAGNTFILGMLTNHSVVGYYSAAEKIVKAVQGLLGPLSQAAYPRFSKMASESKALALQWARRMLVLMGGLGLALSVTLFVGTPVIVGIVLGPEYEPSIMVIRILTVQPLLIGASNVLGVQIMLPFGKDRAFISILLGAGLINIALAILLTPIWKEVGMAAAVLFSEAFVTVSMLIYLKLCHLNPLTIRSGVIEQ